MDDTQNNIWFVILSGGRRQGELPQSKNPYMGRNAGSCQYRGPSTPRSSAKAEDLVAQDDKQLGW